MDEQEAAAKYELASQDAYRRLMANKARTGTAILGRLPEVLTQDPKYSQDYRNHSFRIGEALAKASLTAELFILDLAQIPQPKIRLYLGRSQFPSFQTRPVSGKSRFRSFYKDPQLDCMHQAYTIVSSCNSSVTLILIAIQ